MSIRVTYIGASWCKVCVTVKPEIEKITGGFSIPLTVLDVDDGVDIKKVPTVRIYKDDVLVKEIVTGHVAALMETLIGLQ
jgi:hypothetical protein